MCEPAAACEPYRVPSSYSTGWGNRVPSPPRRHRRGVVVAAGANWSEMQPDAGNTTETNTNLGFGVAVTGSSKLRLAEDFTVPAGEDWTLTDLDIYGYKLGATT